MSYQQIVHTGTEVMCSVAMAVSGVICEVLCYVMWDPAHNLAAASQCCLCGSPTASVATDLALQIISHCHGLVWQTKYSADKLVTDTLHTTSIVKLNKELGWETNG